MNGRNITEFDSPIFPIEIYANWLISILPYMGTILENTIMKIAGKWHFWSYHNLKTAVTTKWIEEISLHRIAQYYHLIFMQISLCHHCHIWILSSKYDFENCRNITHLTLSKLGKNSKSPINGRNFIDCGGPILPMDIYAN